VWAQSTPFQTPGMPSQTYGAQPSGQTDMSQANRFSSVFNPAFSFVGDFVADYRSGGGNPVGWNMNLRNLEVMAQAWVDPTAWAYFVAASDGEALNVEEGAVHYVGLGGHNTIRAGKFFIDFGKQMQTHVHELRTVERPLALRVLLGEEVKGNGIEWDDWVAAGDSTAIRWSIGAFANLLPETPADFDPTVSASPSVLDRKSAGDMNFTARLTGFTDVGANGVLQLGASARVIPKFQADYAPSSDELTDLRDTVVGTDITYGWKSDTGVNAFTLGGEYLIDTGDTGFSITNPGGGGAIALDKSTLNGWFAFADYALDQNNSFGVQYSQVELPDGSTTNVTEADIYYSRTFSEFQRIRLDLTRYDPDGADASFRAAIQYSFIVGAHGHGVNW
jgi:hypothetical protein